MSSIALAVEDDLSAAVGSRIVEVTRPDYSVSNCYVCSGSGLMKRRLAAFNNAAQAIPYLLIADLDQTECPPALLSQWFRRIARRPQLLFRVAVREIEAWLMADRTAFARFLGVAVNRVPAYPEQLIDAKAELIRLARTSPRRQVRRALIPIGNARQGPEHNDALVEFVNSYWRMADAAANCPSLQRAVDALARLPV